MSTNLRLPAGVLDAAEQFLTSTAAAGSIGFINSFGNLGGGGIGTPLMGYLKEHTGS